MAEFIFKALVKAKGLESQYHIESAAVSTEEIGNPIYPKEAIECQVWWGFRQDLFGRVQQCSRREFDPLCGLN